MKLAEQARNAVDALSVFATAKPGVWFPETINNEILYWREGLARNLATLGPFSIHDAYREIPADLGGLISWCLDIAGASRAA